MEARYRKEADAEPAKRDRHLADADAWARLADVRAFFTSTQRILGERLAKGQSRSKLRE
jgi:hypothetical protein